MSFRSKADTSRSALPGALGRANLPALSPKQGFPSVPPLSEVMGFLKHPVAESPATTPAVSWPAGSFVPGFLGLAAQTTS